MRMMTKMYMKRRKGVWIVEWWVGGLGFQYGCMRTGVLMIVGRPREGRRWWRQRCCPAPTWCSTCRSTPAARWRRWRHRPTRCRSGLCGTSRSAPVRTLSQPGGMLTSEARCPPLQTAHLRRSHLHAPKIVRSHPCYLMLCLPTCWPSILARSGTLVEHWAGMVARAAWDRRYIVASFPPAPACG